MFVFAKRIVIFSSKEEEVPEKPPAGTTIIIFTRLVFSQMKKQVAVFFLVRDPPNIFGGLDNENFAPVWQRHPERRVTTQRQ